jgi:pimeloyl-ACP methyl ester carboxylesterase
MDSRSGLICQIRAQFNRIFKGRMPATPSQTSNSLPDVPVSSLSVEGVALEVVARGRGKPLLFLHPEIGLDPEAAVLEQLAERTRVIAPSHPGFGRSELPRHMTSVDDLAYFYLDLLETVDLRDVILVGVSLGAWIAAEIAVKTTDRLSHLVLANPLGIKVSDRETRDIVDIFAIGEKEFHQLAYHDASAAARDYPAMSDEDVRIVARNRESTSRFGWSPYLHNPKLRGRLHRIKIPTLVLWGTSDRLAREDYGRAYAAAIPDARFETIVRAGHYPHLEQPEEFARRIFAFTGCTAANSVSSSL